MNSIKELKRLPSPALLPQALTWDGVNLWMGSMETKEIHKIDTDSWKSIWSIPAPGTPYGMVWNQGELRVLCGETSEDNRFIRRLIPDHGFDTQFCIPCPDDTGSQLSYHRNELHVSQWYNQQIHAIGQEGQVKRTHLSPRGICGQVFIGNVLYLANTNDEETDEYYLSRYDLSQTEPKAEDIALIPFKARSLTFDGTHFWTNHREKHETVCFAKPD
ncbi:hypothetical protein MLD52_16450 [Puniceicoccaceae bacterium K14]|nr:hypothetical protein [Puniceicoccaceae bacterium K14]